MGINIDSESMLSEIEKIKRIPFVFIMGKGRSGTTLLQSFLNAHPNIVAPPESKFIVLLSSRFGQIKKWSERDVNEFIQALHKEVFFSNVWKPDTEQLKHVLISALEYLDYPLACRIVYYSMKKSKENILLFSDKNPLYRLCYKTLLTHFPDAKFIHIIRDPRDMVLSHIKTYNATNIMFTSQQWLMANQTIEEKKQKIPGKYFTLLYEKMVADTGKTMADICSFLNVPYIPSMLQVNKEETINAYKDHFAQFEKMHKSLLKPVSTEHVDKWKKEMNPEYIAQVQYVAGKYASEQYGYVMEQMGNVKNPSYLSLLKCKFVHLCWAIFTRYRLRHYNFYLFYERFKRKLAGK